MTNYVEYKAQQVPVRGGAWNDIMNSCFYTVVDRIKWYKICTEDKTPTADSELFAILDWNE